MAEDTNTPGSEVVVARRGAVLDVRINRPQVRNALDGNTISGLTETFEAAARDPAVRAVTLTGQGSSFSAGGDLKSIFESREPQHIRRFLDLTMRPLIRAMLTLDKPILAVLNGAVAGAGIGLALAADMLIASERAQFVPAFGRIGAMPDSGTLYFLTQALGLHKVREIVMLNKTLSAYEAQDLGLCNWVVPAADLEAESRRIADELAAGATVAHGLTKRALRDAARLPFDAFMDLESLSMALLVTTEDQAEGIRAFLEKRAPRFVGR